MDAYRSLLKSKMLWTIIVGGILIAFSSNYLLIDGFTLAAFSCEKVKPDECLMQFKDVFYIPSIILTATISLAGFWSLIFRSEQTSQQLVLASKQIQLTTDNNKFNNFVSHKKEFIELLEAFEEDVKCTIKNKRLLYSLIFPDNNPARMNFGCSEQGLKQLIEVDNKSLNDFYHRLEVSTSIEESLFAFQIRIHDLSNYFEISLNTLVETKIQGIDKSKGLPRNIKDTIEITREMYQLIANFSGANKATEIVQFIPRVLEDDNYSGLDIKVLNFMSQLSYPNDSADK